MMVNPRGAGVRSGVLPAPGPRAAGPTDPTADGLSALLADALGRAGDRPRTLRLICSPCRVLEDPAVAHLLRHGALDRGHRVLFLHHFDRLDIGCRERLGGLLAAGAQVRLFHGPAPNLIVFDSTVAALLPDGDSSGGVDRRDAAIAGVLWRFHAALWEESVELDADAADLDHRLLDDLYFMVLDKLGSGVKDEAAARQIRVSVRTYRRYVASIMQILGVGTRFEAGLKVAELGLIKNRRQRHRVRG